MIQQVYKIGIVGSSKVEDNISAYKQIKEFILEQFKSTPFIEIVSGGADGVDKIAIDIAKELCIAHKEFLPKTQDWAGFKPRNIKIAEYCDEVVSFALPLKTKKCYHCNANHEKTAGCWTAKYARGIPKKGRTIILK